MYFITNSNPGNDPINLGLCTTFYKTSSPVCQEEDYFLIIFLFTGGKHLISMSREWRFSTETERDYVYNEIVREVKWGNHLEG